jgi:hypothetical protein
LSNRQYGVAAGPLNPDVQDAATSPFFYCCRSLSDVFGPQTCLKGPAFGEPLIVTDFIGMRNHLAAAGLHKSANKEQGEYHPPTTSRQALAQENKWLGVMLHRTNISGRPPSCRGLENFVDEPSGSGE